MPTTHDEMPELSTVWLRVFLEVARHGSFTVAARALGWTQSAVSRQVASLEAALGGGPLFDRLPRGVRLTEAGRLLVPHAETVAAALHDARRALDALREAAGGRLRFGAFATADAALVPQALARFRARHPGVRVTREEGFTPALLDRLTAGHLDLAIVSTTGRAPLRSYELHHLLDEPLYLALPAGHPLAGHEGPVPLGRFADADWISGSPRPEGTLLEAALRQGFRPRVAHVVGEWTAKQGYVAAGLGVTLVPALAAEAVRPDVRLLRVLDAGGPARAVYAAAVRGRTLSPAAVAFLGALREAAATIPA
ncbi:LysR family transcriptional regulator [Streptomyces lomondensis]|uniref:LysR family transcriptional regulator n=2 Tax=Streptomyces lomondensis TaxID=68229 RepID=A0ABQ2WWU7_9ACTN|nr:LysR family transcriptional regulator [Streptomyces lomondensis]MCF0078842.1 LysR family transcriptional regulator [Streptomyces lomondensis]GGW81907.1 LysR family transcriptional regulator [Streptomyces lomondensis]